MGRGMLEREVLEVLEGDTHCFACVRQSPAIPSSTYRKGAGHF